MDNRGSSHSGGSNCTATVTYTPARGYVGLDSFTYKANDGSAHSLTSDRRTEAEWIDEIGRRAWGTIAGNRDVPWPPT